MALIISGSVHLVLISIILPLGTEITGAATPLMS